MKKTISIKLLLITLSVLFVLSGAAALAVNQTKTAHAASFTVTSISKTTKENGMYVFKINDSGITVGDGYNILSKEIDDSINVYDKIEINGKSITEWNDEYRTTASGWSSSTFCFPANSTGYYYKMPIFVRGYKAIMRIYIHENIYSIIVAEYGLMDIQVKAGLSEEGNTLSADSDIYVVKDSSGVAGDVVAISDSYIKQGAYLTHERVLNWEQSNDVYKFQLNSRGLTAGTDYKLLDDDSYKYLQKLVKINGKTMEWWNKNTDVSGYSAWSTFPSTAGATYQKPFVPYVAGGGYMKIYVKNDWWNANAINDSIEVSIVPHVYILNATNAYAVTEEMTWVREGTWAVSATKSGVDWNYKSDITEVNASGLTISYVGYSSSAHLWTFNVSGFSGFSVTGYDNVNLSNAITNCIKINGKSITEINSEYASSAASTWDGGSFPQNNSGTPAFYKKPVLFHVGSAGSLDIRIWEGAFNGLRQEGYYFKLKVCAGLSANGVKLTEDKELVFSEETNTFIAESSINYIYPGEISVSRWQPLGDVIYFDVNYAPFKEGTNYKILDNEAYYYLANLIRINGVSMKDINANTDVSGYSAWTTFPSTAGAVYQKPFVTLVKDGTMEVRMKLDWWNANKGDGNSIEISVVPGTFITKDATIYGVKEPAVFNSDPAFSEYTTASWLNAYGKIDNGGYVRIVSDSTKGLRFCAHADQELVDGLIANGATVQFMMNVSREGSAKTYNQACTVYYTENGYYNFNVVITNLASANYSKQYTARPFLRVTFDDDHTDDIYLGSCSRSISYVASAALNDVSESQTEKYAYSVVINGNTVYSPYSSYQRSILDEYVASEVVEVNNVLYSYIKESDGNFMAKSTNSTVNNFFDDYAERYLYADSSDLVIDTVVGAASMSWKDWEATSLMYISSARTTTNEISYAGKVENAVVDKYGYVWEGAELGFFGQGWNLPNYTGRATLSDPYPLDGFEFQSGRKNSSILAIDAGAGTTYGACSNDWVAASDSGSFASATDSASDGGTGYYLADVKSAASYVTYTVSETTHNGVFVASDCRFVEIGFKWLRTSGTLTNIELIFKNGSNNSYTLDLDTWATTSYNLDVDSGRVHLYVPVSEHTNWTGNIKQIQIKINGSSFVGQIYLDYVRGCFDIRMADTNMSFINAGRTHFENTGAVAFLTTNLPKYRRAMQFLISYMTTDGIIDLSKLHGHNGGQGYANSFISTYWDIWSLAPKSSYVNALYYKTLLDMAYLEEAAAANGISVASVSVVSKLTGGTTTTYSETASSLRTKAAAVKSAITADLNTGAHTGYFKNVNSTQGYFIDGWYGSSQIDFGSVAFNLIIIDTGIATDEQAVKILNWMDAQANLYEYEFAPKTNVIDIGNQKVWAQRVLSYGESVQNGGAILFMSYYDILARLKYIGADNAYSRLNAIIGWYNDVKLEYELSGNEPKDFYVEYYDGEETLQGHGSGGTLGLDAEFVENAMLLSVIPDGFVGLDTYYDDGVPVLTVNPNLPDNVKAWKLEDVRYLGVHFDVYVGNSFAMIKNVSDIIEDATDNSKLSITLHYTGATPTVYVNNVAINSGYTVDAVNKTITYTTSTFTETTVVVK